MPDSIQFISSPLITPKRLQADPQASLQPYPAWVRHLEFVTPEPEPEAFPSIQPVVIIWAGQSRRRYEAHTPLTTALMWEITRLPGLSIAVNNNGSKDDYFRFTTEGIGEDLTTVSRFLMDALPYERVLRTPRRKFDMRPETLRKAGGKLSKDSRSVLMAHIERIAKEWEADGGMPAHITAAAYLENLQRLLHLIDLEATGRELSDILPTVERQEA
ncbi:hypothetical protein M8R20_06755 [Pseudomonas sp. R2.Fl]|nr:hypothetical protein [Pseudomonas sp. R2.Fl]